MVFSSSVRIPNRDRWIGFFRRLRDRPRKWEIQGEGYDKAKSLYDDARFVIQFMRHLVRGLAEVLAATRRTRSTSLAAFFPDPNPDRDPAPQAGGAAAHRRHRRYCENTRASGDPATGFGRSKGHW